MVQMRVSFLGIGLMGLPMCQSLLRGGVELRVWNRSPEKTRPLVALGAEASTNLTEAVAGADLIISMLADGEVVNQVADQLLAAGAIAPQTLWVDMSSTTVDQALAMAEKLAAVKTQFMDAPVSGGVNGAQAATLAIMAGAEPDAFERAKPVLELMGRPVRVGGPGSGQVAKLANQSMVAAYIAAVSEAVLLCEAYGVDQSAFRDALKGGFADSSVLQIHGQRMAERAFAPGGKVTTQLKDMNNILAAAQEKQLNLPLARALQARYQTLAQDPERAVLDHSALMLDLLDINEKRR